MNNPFNNRNHTIVGNRFQLESAHIGPRGEVTLRSVPLYVHSMRGRIKVAWHLLRRGEVRGARTQLAITGCDIRPQAGRPAITNEQADLKIGVGDFKA